MAARHGRHPCNSTSRAMADRALTRSSGQMGTFTLYGQAEASCLINPQMAEHRSAPIKFFQSMPISVSLLLLLMAPAARAMAIFMLSRRIHATVIAIFILLPPQMGEPHGQALFASMMTMSQTVNFNTGPGLASMSGGTSRSSILIRGTPQAIVFLNRISRDQQTADRLLPMNNWGRLNRLPILRTAPCGSVTI